MGQLSTAADSYDAIIYARVSHDPRGLGRSVDEQVSESTSLCLEQGWPIVKVFRQDNDKGASLFSRDKREDWERCVQFLESPWPRKRILVTWEASRAQRDLDVYLELRRICELNGILWCYSGKVFDFSLTEDRFTTGLDALLAEREASLTRDRVLRAVRANAAAGRPHGPILFGYAREYDDTPKGRVYRRSVIHPVNGPLVQEMADRALRGESLISIARDFTDRGIPTPTGLSKWSRQSIKKILLNPGYVGKRVYQGKVIGDADWPRLLTDYEHYSCVSLLTDPKRRTSRGGSIKHLLTGVARCAVCQEVLGVNKHHNGYFNYLCRAGFHVAMKEALMDRVVEQVVFNRLMQPSFARVFTQDRTTEVEQALVEAAEKRSRLEGFYDEAAKGNLSPQALARIEQSLLVEINSAEQRASLGLHPVMRDVAEAVSTTSIEMAWETFSIGQKREVIKTLMDILLYPSVMQGIFDPSRVKILWKGSDEQERDRVQLRLEGSSQG